MNGKLNEIKEKIRTTHPSITSELLDLLYEYISVRHANELYETLKSDEVQKLIKDTTLDRLITK